ncbi:MAG: amidophosphoribosyltransferase [Gloeomargaritaceae cyanobacterium C42_A2020_066]|nr:amidophosphoribosyltransferase [Gloeomargaritaceae cyanobacterium C42_A2020_066]
MCGIAGMIGFTSERRATLGQQLVQVIEPLEGRGPDSCGVGLYTAAVAPDQWKLMLQGDVTLAWSRVADWLATQVPLHQWDGVSEGCYRAVIGIPDRPADAFKHALRQAFPGLHIPSAGRSLEIYKEVGSASQLDRRVNLSQRPASHGLAHTRMATESVVNTDHAHPFSAGLDLAIVHNGQISNYHKLKYALERRGVVLETENDSETIAHYLHLQLTLGFSLEAALAQLLKDFDGTYTILVATSEKLALVRDRYAAKPAVVYEKPDQVVIASEYHCLTHLPSFDRGATLIEPDAAEILVWSVTTGRPAALALSPASV